MFGYSAKRQREPDELIDSDDNIDPREKKKPRPLALRTSPNTLSQPSFPSRDQFPSQFRHPALTPVESSDDEEGDNGGKYSGIPPGVLKHGLRPPSLSLGTATAMDLDTGKDIHLHPLLGGDNLSPWPVGSSGHGSIQPSPIPHGLVNQSLNISGGHTPTTLTSSAGGYFPVTVPSTDAMESESTRSTEGQAPKGQYARSHEATAWWCRQRLPSPISENEGSPTSSRKASPCDAEMSYSYSVPSRPASPPPCDPHDPHAAHRNDCVQNQDPLSCTWAETTSDPIKHHEQSSISIKSTKQTSSGSPGKKKIAFSMGYRADCEKCRRKVPGHYSHIIRS